jgi:hypothetical protein
MEAEPQWMSPLKQVYHIYSPISIPPIAIRTKSSYSTWPRCRRTSS